MRLKSKRLISLLLAGSMMVSMLPASAVTAFAETTANNSVTSEAAQNVAVTVDGFTTGQLEAAVRDAARLQNVTDISQITELTVSGGTMNKTDFEFVSGVHVEGNGYDWNSVTYNESNVALSNMSTLDLSDTLNEAIPARAFNKNTKLVKIVLPKNLTRIEIGAFASMPNLQYLSKDESTNLRFDGVTFMGQSMVNGDKKLTDELQLPSSLKAIGSTCFSNTGVRGNITISGTTDIYNNADYTNYPQTTPDNRLLFSYTEQNGTGTNIESIKFEHGIEIVPSHIANGCKNLKKVYFSDTVKTIKSHAFYNTSLEGTLVIPQTVTQIEERAFAFNRNIDNIIIGNPNVSLGARVFAAHKNGVKVYLSSAAITAGNDSWNNQDEEHALAVLLDVDGGTIETDGNGNVTAKPDDTTGLYTPTKDGYKFAGWCDANGNKLTTVAEAGKTYYATYKTIHTVTFADADVEPVKVADGEQLEKPADPKKDGYKFDYWCAANGNKVDFPLPINADITLTAKWTPYKTTVEPKVETNADPASKTVEITVDVEAAPAELAGATATLNFTDADGHDDSDNVVEVKVNGKTVNKDENDKYTAKLSDLMQKTSDASENGTDAVMLADVNEVVPGTVKGTARLTVTYKTPGKHNVGIVLNAANGDVIRKATVPVEIAPEPGTLNLTGCTATLEDGTPVENGAKVPVGAEVTVTFEPDADSDLVLNGWNVTPETLTDTNGKLVKDITADTFTFVMPETDEGVTIAAQTKAAAPAEDDSLDAAAVVTGVVLGTGTAILAYHIGTEVYAEQVLGKGVAIPRTREEVALKAWELAGKPAVELNGEPLSEAAQAEKWAVESGLMQNVDGSFNGSKKMSKLKALRTLDAAKKLG